MYKTQKWFPQSERKKNFNNNNKPKKKTKDTFEVGKLKQTPNQLSIRYQIYCSTYRYTFI